MAYHWILYEIYGVPLKSLRNLWRTIEIANKIMGYRKRRQSRRDKSTIPIRRPLTAAGRENLQSKSADRGPRTAAGRENLQSKSASVVVVGAVVVVVVVATRESRLCRQKKENKYGNNSSNSARKRRISLFDCEQLSRSFCSNLSNIQKN